jgi:yecA family protein
VGAGSGEQEKGASEEFLMNSLSRRYRLAHAEADEFLPPNLSAMDALSFGEAQRTRLSGWLSEAGWPRRRMNMAELEGYLTALIAWPVGIASGAWLPPVWGERGWKVPRKIATRDQFEELIALIVGFMQHLEGQLSLPASRFDSSVLRTVRGSDLVTALHGWGRGFTKALTLGSQGLQARGATSRAAVYRIATLTSASVPPRPQSIEGIVEAVLALMKLRDSRGPLGPLAEATLPADEESPAALREVSR